MLVKCDLGKLFDLASQRMGESLDGVSFEDLRSLEEDMESSLKTIRERKVSISSFLFTRLVK